MYKICTTNAAKLQPVVVVEAFFKIRKEFLKTLNLNAFKLKNTQPFPLNFNQRIKFVCWPRRYCYLAVEIGTIETKFNEFFYERNRPNWTTAFGRKHKLN